MQRKYLQAIQQRSDVNGSPSEKEVLHNFLSQREEVVLEIDTRYLEDERRKAEEDFAKVFSCAIVIEYIERYTYNQCRKRKWC